MCGRYTHLFSWDELHHLLDLVVPSTEATKSFNVAPTHCPPIIRRQDNGQLKIHFIRWGLIPPWVKDLKSSAPLINARAETVDTKPSFRSAFKSRHCLVPVTGYYEWVEDKASKKKKAYYITPKNNDPLIFAGLWESWNNEDSQSLESFTIITTSANNFLSQLHDRMPVILQKDNFEKWLNPSTTTEQQVELLKPADDNLFKFYEVSTVVNSPRNNSEECIAEISSACP